MGDLTSDIAASAWVGIAEQGADPQPPAHLVSAAAALESILNAKYPDQGLRVNVGSEPGETIG